jgi:hypothetical protein
MQRHRGFFLGLALSALLGLMGNQAHAGNIILTVDLNGVVVYTAPAGPDQPTSVAAVTAVLNTDLAAAGSAYHFSSLSAQSNFSGAGTGFLTVTGQLTVLTTGSTTAVLSIDATQSGFLSPVGSNGMLTSSASSTYVNTSGSVTYQSDYQGTSTSAPIALGTGTGSDSHTNAPPTGIGSVPTGYSLSDHFSIQLAQPSVGGPMVSEGVSGSTIVSATTIPEPASVVMLLTGMPLPLAIVFGLIRRRRAGAEA